MSDAQPTGTPPQQPTPYNGAPTTATPAPGETTPTPPSAATPSTLEPFRAFATQADLDKFVSGSKRQAQRAALREAAQRFGFEEWSDVEDALQALRPTAPTPEPEAQRAQQSQSDSNEATRLRLALKVGAAKGLPATLVMRLQGSTEEEMTLDADTLLGLVQQPATVTRHATPGIPPPPQGGQPVTFTRQQLSDPKFVREHQDEIRQAYAQGRVVGS